ncbi:MAG: hypothetical protein GW836_08230 [Paraglaciecola sp.]|nr:hypothetical protein [Paraglaciecola sp.]
MSSFVGFACSDYLWPAQHDHDSHWYDLLEVVVEFPFRAVALLLRSLGRLIKHSDSSIDLEL